MRGEGVKKDIGLVLMLIGIYVLVLGGVVTVVPSGALMSLGVCMYLWE